MIEECPGRNIERSIHSKLHRGLTKNLGHPLGRIAFHNLFTGSEHLPSPADSNLVSGEGNSFRLRLKSKGKKGNKVFQRLKVWAAPAALGLLLTSSPLSAEPKEDDVTTFEMVVSAGAKTCLPNASATVSIRPTGGVEIMEVTVRGLPPETDFDFFVIQVPKSPIGVAWYQGDIHTDKNGRGHQRFMGRFSIETFSFAFGSAPAPLVFPNDAGVNPPFNPIQMYHLGLWFDSFGAAQAAGCPATQTFFNGQHAAGFQVLNTSNFADDHGPLRDVNPSAQK